MLCRIDGWNYGEWRSHRSVAKFTAVLSYCAYFLNRVKALVFLNEFNFVILKCARVYVLPFGR